MNSIHPLMGDSGQRLIAQVERLEATMPRCEAGRLVIESAKRGQEAQKMLSSLGKLAEEAS